MSTRVYVVVNRELKMSSGKIAAQVAHAVARMAIDMEPPQYPKTMIVLEATAEQIRNIDSYLTSNGIYSHLYIDEGVNEIPPFSITALAVEPFDEDADDYDEKKSIFQDLLLLSDPKWYKRLTYER